MFDQPTTFILGAGASWHYGYPTGYDLIEKITDLASSILEIEDFRNGNYNPSVPLCYLKNKDKIYAPQTAYAEAWKELKQECNNLILRLNTSDPLSIDFFLSKNPSVTKISKILIGWILLECEYNYKLNRHNPNRDGTTFTPQKKEDNWVRFIVQKLLNATNINDNRIDFITFNYDLSLEEKIQEALINTESVKQSDIDIFFKNRVHHVYGRITKPTDISNIFVNYKVDPEAYIGKIIDYSYECSTNIEIIAPKNKIDLSGIHTKISNARSVYILGYGFDDMNNSNLNLPQLLKRNVCDDLYKKVYFTNMGDRNIINKKVGNLFFNDISVFMPGESFIKTGKGHNSYYEKSTKSVYEALSEDFDL